MALSIESDAYLVIKTDRDEQKDRTLVTRLIVQPKTTFKVLGDLGDRKK